MYRCVYTCLLFILILIFFNCGKASSQILSNSFKNVTSAIASDLTNSPVVQNVAIAAGNAVLDATNPFFNFGTALARLFGNGKEIPAFALNRNIVDLGYDSEAFKAGLGNEDARLNIQQLITKYGYPVEKHQVVTEDLYNLTVFRIPNEGVPVFLMHGITGSADDFIIAGPENGLAYLLAKDGFDVWLGNARGNKFSRKHAFLDPSEAKFWDFTWHEIGYYDLPAMIDYVLKVTGRKQLRYIGHSQGTTTFFVMASERPEYNEKIKVMIALAPAAFLSNMKTPVTRLLAPGTSILHAIAKTTGTYEIADTKGMQLLKAFFCSNGPLTSLLCWSPVLLLLGISSARVNITNLPVILGHTPSGASIKQFAHFGQIILSTKFRQFDYGPLRNLKEYGSRDPPDYKLENIVTPVVLFYGPDDWLVQPKDVEKLASRLSNVVAKYNMPLFNHNDFVIAKDFKTSVYPFIIKWL